MPRYTRNNVLLAKVESSYGTDSTPTGSEAMLCSRPQFTNLEAQNVPRDVELGYLGAKEHLVGSMFRSITFDVELVGSGTAGTAPAWGDLLLACGWAETETASTRVDYTLVSSAFPSVSIYWYEDGLLYKLLGARGNVEFVLSSGNIPVMRFSFKGLYSAATATSNATPSHAAFQTGQVVNEQNTGDLSFGGTHSTSGAPAISGATAYPSRGIQFALNNTVEHVPLLGGESIELTQREPSCSFSLELTAAQKVTVETAVTAGTLTSIGLVHGTEAGKKVLLWLPYVQRINLRSEDLAGKVMAGMEGRVVPSAGNDEARLVLF